MFKSYTETGHVDLALINNSKSDGFFRVEKNIVLYRVIPSKFQSAIFLNFVTQIRSDSIQTERNEVSFQKENLRLIPIFSGVFFSCKENN